MPQEQLHDEYESMDVEQGTFSYTHPLIKPFEKQLRQLKCRFFEIGGLSGSLQELGFTESDFSTRLGYSG